MMAPTQSFSWLDLRPELLGLVFVRLPSLADRVRVRAVCRSWRQNAQLELLPPPLPWLSLLDGTFLSFPGGEIHRMPVPDGACYHGSVENWLFLMNSDGGCSLMNPFSKTMLQLPKLDTIWHNEMGHTGHLVSFKFVVLSSLDLSPDSPMAAMMIDDSLRSGICICQPPVATDILRKNDHDHIYDVVFFNGKLFALISGKLFVLEIVENQSRERKIASIKCISGSLDYLSVDSCDSGSYFRTSFQYLVESAGKLLLVARTVGIPLPLPSEPSAYHHAHTLSFKVYEVDLATDSCRQWRRLSSLAGQALFVGTYSKSVPAAECGLPQGDCIYFTCDYMAAYGRPPPDPLSDSGVFNMRNGMITPLLPETTVVRRVPQGCPTWFFPSSF